MTILTRTSAIILFSNRPDPKTVCSFNAGEKQNALFAIKNTKFEISDLFWKDLSFFLCENSFQIKSSDVKCFLWNLSTGDV